MKPSLRQPLLVAAAALAGGGAAVAVGAATTSSTSVTTVQAAAPLPAANVSQTASGISPSAIYRNDAPGVVLITATSQQKQTDPLDPFAQPQTGRSVAIGSGFVTDAAGHIYTNAHVVLGASSVKVTFKKTASGPGATYPARVLGADKATDVAVLQVQGAPPSALHPLPIGSLSTVRVGDPVVAIGNPLNEQSTITSGIVSAVGRQIYSLEPGQRIYNVIQTDAAINHGNSGGPLIDRFGRVIGITSQILTGSTSDPNAGNIGIGFAIPIDKVSEIARQLITKGHAEHTYLGIKGTEITPDLQQAINLPVGAGVLVGQVVPGSPADMAGIKGGSTTATIGGEPLTLGGDIITSIDGRKITSFANLAETIAAKSAGDQVTLGILRDGKAMTVTVTLANNPG
jgi:S1-C subfamily serine protease